jgi:hypothetical protein
MSKLYMMNRMRYGAEAGDIFSVLGGAAKFVGGLFKSKGAKAAAALAKKIATNPLAQTAAIVAGGEVAGALLAPRGARAGASGGWTGRRRKGITATELRGFRKVAALLHKEGMTIKKHRRA